MIKQYPHYLFAVTNEQSVQDENGNWIKQGATNIFLAKCREETEGKGKEIQVADGTFHRFSSLIQLPKNTQRIEIGTTIFVADNQDGSIVRIRGSVLKFDIGQLHSRLWL